MARPKTVKKTTTNTKPRTSKVVEVEEELDDINDEVYEDDDEEIVEAPKKRVFNKDDLIPCVSITPGEMFFEGEKTHNLYIWANIGFVTEIEYQDLNYALQQNHPMIIKPRFIIQDDDIIAQHPELDKIYSGLYSVGDLKKILNKTPSEIENEVAKLPTGAKEALKGIVSTQISNGTLDSVNRIKALDRVLGTEMLLKLSGNV